MSPLLWFLIALACLVLAISLDPELRRRRPPVVPAGPPPPRHPNCRCAIVPFPERPAADPENTEAL